MSIGSKNYFQIHGHSSTNPAKLSKIGSINLETIGLKRIVKNNKRQQNVITQVGNTRTPIDDFPFAFLHSMRVARIIKTAHLLLEVDANRRTDNQMVDGEQTCAHGAMQSTVRHALVCMQRTSPFPANFK